MKIRFLQDHGAASKGDVEEVNGDRGKAFIEAGIAELADGPQKEKKQIAQTAEKNANAGPKKK